MEQLFSPCNEAVRKRLKQEQQFARIIMFAVDQEFADRTADARAFSLRPPLARGPDQGVVEGSAVPPVASERVFLQAAE